MRLLALVIPVNNLGQVLLQHRDAKAPIKPNHWAFFGGHMEPGEAPEDTARREFKEELQIELGLGDLKFFDVYFFEEEYGPALKYYFTTRLSKDPQRLKEFQLEGDDLGYFGYNRLDDLNVSDNDRKVLDDLNKNGIFK